MHAEVRAVGPPRGGPPRKEGARARGKHGLSEMTQQLGRGGMECWAGHGPAGRPRLLEIRVGRCQGAASTLGATPRCSTCVRTTFPAQSEELRVGVITPP